jgi:hypothetical protein
MRGSGAIAEGRAGVYGPSPEGLPTGSSPSRQIGDPGLRGSLTGIVAQSHGSGAIAEGRTGMRGPPPGSIASPERRDSYGYPGTTNRGEASRFEPRSLAVPFHGRCDVRGMGVVLPLLIVYFNRESYVMTFVVRIIATMMKCSSRSHPTRTQFNHYRAQVGSKHGCPVQDGVLSRTNPLTPDERPRASTMQ